MKIVKQLLKFYFKHIFIILAASKRAVFHHSTYSYSGIGSIERTLSSRPMSSQLYSLIYTSKFSLTSFPWQVFLGSVNGKI